jgi:hypothetical protein
MNEKNSFDKQSGYQKLWEWFGLSRASWITIPRVLAHEMPDVWQRKMADLLSQFDDFWNFSNDNFGVTVRTTINNKFCKTPDWLINYRHPDQEEINKRKVKRRWNEKDVSEIVKEYLIKNGFHGLGMDECGCVLEDLMTCSDNCSECTPRYKIENPDCENCTRGCEGYDGKEKPPYCLSTLKKKKEADK